MDDRISNITADEQTEGVLPPQDRDELANPSDDPVVEDADIEYQMRLLFG